MRGPKPSRYAKDLHKLVRNLRRLYSESTPDERARGMDWYPQTVRACVTWGETFGIDADVIACVIAAISPQVEWSENLRVALSVLQGHAGQGRALRVNVEKARRALADSATSLDSYFLAGHKVRAFAANLQGDADTVTIDTHAAQAALRDPLARPRVDRAAHYHVFAEAYRKAARLDGHRPCDYQAILWLTWKRKYSPERKRSMIAAAKAA